MSMKTSSYLERRKTQASSSVRLGFQLLEAISCQNEVLASSILDSLEQRYYTSMVWDLYGYQVIEKASFSTETCATENEEEEGCFFSTWQELPSLPEPSHTSLGDKQYPVHCDHASYYGAVASVKEMSPSSGGLTQELNTIGVCALFFPIFPHIFPLPLRIAQ